MVCGQQMCRFLIFGGLTLEDDRRNQRPLPVDEFTGCWNWAGAMVGGKSPRIWQTEDGKDKSMPGRRAAWLALGRELPSGWRVYGTCDSLVCVKPAHMKAGLTAEFWSPPGRAGKQKGNINRIKANRLNGRKRAGAEPRRLLRSFQQRNRRGTGRGLGVAPATISGYRRHGLPCYEPVGGLFHFPSRRGGIHMIAAASATRAVVVVSRGDRPDWWKITDDLRKAGVTIEQQAQIVGVSKAAVLGWRNLDAEPSYTAGHRMLALWAERVMPARQCVRQTVATPEHWSGFRPTPSQILAAFPPQEAVAWQQNVQFAPRRHPARYWRRCCRSGCARGCSARFPARRSEVDPTASARLC